MAMRNVWVLILLAGMILTTACSDDDSQPCFSDMSVFTDNGICLVIDHPGLSENQQDLIESKVAIGIEQIIDLMPIRDLNIQIVENQTFIIPAIGIGGFNPDPENVLIAIDTGFIELDLSLEEELIPLLAHEVHHAKRRRSVGYGNTLLRAVVSEGLADHFSIEVAGGDPPPWSLAVTGLELQQWIDMVSATWNQPGYNHNKWFFSTDPDIPWWLGYSMGYELVRAYLEANPGALPSQLHDEPASSFEP